MIMDKILKLLSDRNFRKYLMSRGREDAVITTRVKHHVKISHDLGEGLTEEEASRLFKLFYDEGMVKEELYTNVVACPYCDSTDIRISYSCPRCQSLDITKQYIIQHLNCGGSFPSESLRLSKCPACGAKIESSEELRVRGGLFKCKSCGYLFDIPSINFTCNDCGKTFSLREAQIRKINLYSFKEDSKKILDILFVYKRIAEEFLAKGYAVDMPAEIQGASGVTHTFALVIHDEKGNNYIIDLSGYIDDLRVESMIKNYIKIMDINSGKYIYVVSNKKPEVEAFVRSIPTKNAVVIEAKDVDEIIKKIEEFIISESGGVGGE